MNILKVSCVEYGKDRKSTQFNVDTAELTAEEFAELRFLVDLSQILDSHDTQKSVRPKVSICVETKDRRHDAQFMEEPPDEVMELIDCIKSLSKVHADPLQRRSA